MKILFYSSYFYPYVSGITTYPLLLLKQLSKDWQITVLTFAHQKGLKAQEKITDLTVIRQPYLFKISKGFIAPLSIFYYWQHLLKTDLVFINLPNVEALPLALLAKLLKKRIVCLYHCQVTLGNHFFEKIVEKVLRWAVNVQLSLADKVVFYTKDYYRSLKISKKKARDEFILPMFSIQSVNVNYLDHLLSRKQNYLWVGFAGRIAREKGIEYLIEATSQLKTNKKIALVFAGPYGKEVVGEEPYYQKIVTLLKKSQLPHLFLGTLKEGKLSAFYKAIDVLVLPSINQTEAFGMVQVEAMLAGTPVVASNLPGVRQIIKLTNMGQLVEPANADKLSDNLLELLKQKEKYNNNRLIKQVREIFSNKKSLTLWQNLLEKLSHDK